MVSVMLMPAMVVALSLPWSRIWIRIRLIRLLDRYRATKKFSRIDPIPTSVMITLYRSIITMYTIIMIVFTASGATVSTSVCAMEALVLWRIRISPVIRWEKNSIGSRSTFHI